MGQYTSYFLYEKYEKRGEQEAIPAYPNVYSIDADGTMQKVIKLEDDPQCGYDPPTDPIYKWVNIPITQDYICEDCEIIAIYRWVNMDASVDYYCEGTTKYYKQKKQVSYDSGTTWTDVVPAEYQKGEVAETESTDCGYIPPQPEPMYRWVNLDPSVEYYCSGTTKMYKQQKEQSSDSGETWTPVVPSEFRMGEPYQTESTDCGYIPPTPTGKKLIANYSDGTTNEVDCNDNPTLTSGETKPSGYQASRMTEAVIGGCVSNLGLIPTDEEDVPRPFADCTSLSSVTISNSVTLIGEDAFNGCTNLTNIIIPDSVTEIGGGAFYSCNSLSSVTLSNSIVRLRGRLFGGCDSITSVGKIGSGASVEIPNSVTVIDSWCFAYSNYIESINLPDKITSIGVYAFSPQVNFNNLKTVVIGSGITSIYDGAFEDNNGLLSITIKAIVPPTLKNGQGGTRLPMPFEDTNNCPIYVPSGSVNQYKNAQFWTRYASRIQAIS